MVLISTTELTGAAAASISFASVPQDYTDLAIRFTCRSTNASTDTNLLMVLNGNTTANQTLFPVFGNGSTAAGTASNTTALVIGKAPAASAQANTFGNGYVYLYRYSETGILKYGVGSSVTEDMAILAYQYGFGISTGNISLTQAITSITISCLAGNLAQYSSVSLYGVIKGSGGATVA